MTAWSDPAPAWIYALPGSSLAPGLTAGSPPLADLDDLGGPWQAWLLYGPPPMALASLAQQAGADLDGWRRQLQLAGQLKRRHRQRFTVLNTAGLNADAMAALQRQLPELQRQPLPDGRTELLALVASTVLRLDPALRAAYLELEAEADTAGNDGQAPWRLEPAADDWLALLRQGDDGGTAVSPTGPRSQPLAREGRRLQEWVALLQDHEDQLERELEGHQASVQAMAALLPRLEAQLARARRALEQTP
ncbi:MAG: hypothetical protein ACKO2F_11085 [Cyanobacteriota bacterium]